MTWNWKWEYNVMCDAEPYTSGRPVVLQGTVDGASWAEAVNKIAGEMDRWVLVRATMGDLGEPPKYLELLLQLGSSKQKSIHTYWLLDDRHQEEILRVEKRRSCVHGWMLWRVPGGETFLVRAIENSCGLCYWECKDVKDQLHVAHFLDREQP